MGAQIIAVAAQERNLGILLRTSLVLLVLGLASSGCKQSPDLTTPKAAATAFAKAVVANDVAAIRASSAGSEQEYKAAEAFALLRAATAELDTVAKEKFGQDNAVSTRLQMGDMVRAVETATVAEVGDTATLSDPKNEHRPVKVKKVAGQWRVDLSSIVINAEAGGQLMSRVARNMQDLAAAVKTGRYANADAVNKALESVNSASGVSSFEHEKSQ